MASATTEAAPITVSTRVESQADLPAEWAETRVGGVLEVARFVVTECCDD
jgi:hypothetical protein